MTEQYFEGVTPVGRMISGAIFTTTDKGFQGKVLDKPVHYVQIAIPKTDPGLQAVISNMTAAAKAGFFNNEPNRTDFAWKYKDGDQPENAGREGWADCFVFTFRTGLPLAAIVDMNNNQVLDPNKIKNGYQVRVAYSVKANGDTAKPGIYLNFSMVQLVSADKEIITGPAAETVFAAPAQAMPMQPGAVAQAPAAQAPVVPGYPTAQAPAAQAPAAPGYPTAQALAAQAPAAPGYPTAQAPAAQAPAAPGYPTAQAPAAQAPAAPGYPTAQALAAQAPVVPGYPTAQALAAPGYPTTQAPGVQADPTFLNPQAETDIPL
jgi:hypothetical protein